MVQTEINYFTEIEDHFRAARGTGLFRLSPLDWALVETWKNSGIPLEAVLRGIDAAFAKWRRRPSVARTQMVNSSSYCAQAIAAEAQAMVNAAPFSGAGTNPPFDRDAVRAFVARNAAALKEKGYSDLAASLEALDIDSLFSDLEQLERHLTSIEEELFARLRAATSETASIETRRDVDHNLKPYQGKMTSDQIAMLEKQFIERRLLEMAGVPRLSLFYL